MDGLTQRRARRGEARAWLDSHLASIEAGDFSNACILWPFSTNGSSGGRYPQIRIDGRMVRITRYVYERITGLTLAPDELIRHSCDTPRCVNPWHFEVGSHDENMADMVKRMRQASRERNGRAKLTEAAIAEIRALGRDFDLRGSRSLSFVARAYGVSPRTIVGILAGTTWAAVE